MGVVTAITVYMVLNFINVDKIIASKNFDHFVTTGHLDRAYITTLSIDAYEVIEKEKKKYWVKAIMITIYTTT